MNQATQIHQTSENPLAAGILVEFSDVFKDQLGVLKGIEAKLTVDESAFPRFHKPTPIPFALEQQLQKQVNDGELISVDKSKWATAIVVVHKKDGEIRICGNFKVPVNSVIKAQVYPLPIPECIGQW